MNARGCQAVGAAAGWLKCGLMSIVLLALAACAPIPVPPTVGAPAFPDLVYPATPAGGSGGSIVADERLESDMRRAWRSLQAGDTRLAEAEFTALVRRKPGFYPAETGLACVGVGQRRFKESLARFERVVAIAPRYAPALAGRAEALLGLSRQDDAIASYEEALAADPSLTDVRRRLELLRFGNVRGLIAAARRAGDGGRHEEAHGLYEQALAATPDSGFLYREIAAIEITLNAIPAAVEHLRKATVLDPGDARSWLMLGTALEKAADLEGAEIAYERAREFDPGGGGSAALEGLLERAALSRLPPEYRAIASESALTRGDLAALVGVRFQRQLASARRLAAEVVTDVRGHWAAPWILSVSRAGVMEAYPNHTFEPAQGVRRGDLARVAVRMMDVLGPVAVPPLRKTMTDVGRDHLGYQDIATAVAAGVMPLLEGDAFGPARPVGGAEAIDVLDRIARVLRPKRGEAGV
jgi:tetratricopeptide (TPR) repeat protein